MLSLETVEELSEVLGRKKFDCYVTINEREEFLEALINQAILVELTETVSVCRDPRDDKFLSLALSGRADYLISGDDDLLVLDGFRGIRILAPSFLQDIRLERDS